ncbi:MAG: Gfo/Idh/MocA family oxidoreductase [Epulopiscium sp.]|nr:Gfo/Idh/MocA family oxidoreductase [Candidatus Epulonipiscium sp.]
MSFVKIGIIGIGNMGRKHALNIKEGRVPGAKLIAVCDWDQDQLQWAKEHLGSDVKLFDSAESMFDANVIDAVLVATPHYDHPPLAIQAFEKGLHVLIEKPAGVYTKQVREMNEVAAKTDKVFGIMYNQRTNPIYRKLKDLIDSGELGEIRRVNWIITSWYRSQSYYDSGGWRATWAGEGGGVLLNQDPHQLDLWQWLCGMPKRVRAFMGFGKMHNIEVEDDVTAYVEYENGATGVFITSTSDTPGTNRLEITGDHGKIVVEDDHLKFWRLRIPERQFNKEYTGGFGEPECWKCEVPIEGENSQHIGILKNWVLAILKGTPLLAPGEEGILGLTLSNAMHLSAWTDDWVDLPMDEDLFYEKLEEKIKSSTFKKTVRKATFDVTGTH